MNNNSPIELSEKLMRIGWWDEARKVLDQSTVTDSDRYLQTVVLVCRQECCEYITKYSPVTPRSILAHFDRFTVFWALEKYQGDEKKLWQISGVEVNGKTV